MAYIDLLMEKAGFPEASRSFLRDLSLRVAADPRYEPLAKKLLDHDYVDVSEALLNPLRDMAPEFGVHEYTMDFAFYLDATELLREKYLANNISEELFWFAMIDYRCKLIECMDCEGLWGTMSAAWHAPFFHLTRFAHGRLQYDYSTLDAEVYTRGGYTIRRGESCLRIHIPSAGPLTKELRLDSYRRAWEFNKERYNGVVPISCGSWILYPGQADFLPPTSNILGFVSDFDMLSFTESKTFSNAWRVYGKQAQLPVEEWPEHTSVQRGYKKRMLEGKPVGSGYGIFFQTENGRVY